MKKLLLLCAMVIVCALLLPQGVMAAADSKTATLDANPSASITISVDNVPATWTLASSGANTLNGGTITVTSNTGWGVAAVDAAVGNLGTKTSGDEGYMTNYTAGNFVASPLNTRIGNKPSVTVTGTGGTTNANLASSADVLDGSGTVTARALHFDVTTAITDSRLPASHTYHMDVQFTGTTTF